MHTCLSLGRLEMEINAKICFSGKSSFLIRRRKAQTALFCFFGGVLICFSGDLILSDPAYLVKSNADWLLILPGSDTQRTVLDENGRKIGTFCTDSSLFCICDLAQVLEYHPDFLSKNEKYPGTFCIVRDFDGEVSLTNDENGNLQFIGTGKNAFRTVCSGGNYEN